MADLFIWRAGEHDIQNRFPRRLLPIHELGPEPQKQELRCSRRSKCQHWPRSWLPGLRGRPRDVSGSLSVLRAGCDRGQGRLTGQGVGTLSPGRGNLFSTAAADGATGGLQRTVGGSTLEARVWLFFRVYLLFKKNNKSFFRGWLSHAAPGPPSSRSFQTVASLSSLVLATLLPFPGRQRWGWEWSSRDQRFRLRGCALPAAPPPAC